MASLADLLADSAGQSRVNPSIFAAALNQGPVRTPFEGLSRVALAAALGFAGKKAEDRKQAQLAETLGQATSIPATGVPAFNNPETVPVDGVAPGQPLVPQRSQRQAVLATLLNGTIAPEKAIGLANAISPIQKPQETFTPVLDGNGNVVGQRSSLTQKVVADPRAPDLLSQAEMEQQLRLRQAGKSSTTVNVGPTGVDYGEPPKDMVWARDAEGNVALSEPDERGFRSPVAIPIAGGPVEREEQSAAAANVEKARQAAVDGDFVLQDIRRAKALASRPGLFPTTGFGALANSIPGTPQHDLASLLNTVKASVGFDKLQAMREASPTGGALGQVSEMENRLLQSVRGSLEQSQSQEQFMFNMTRLESYYAKTIHGVVDEETGEIRKPVLDDFKMDVSAMDVAQLKQFLASVGGSENLTPGERKAFEARMKELGL